MGVSVMVMRMKAAKKPVSPKKIILPPFFMSTGALMFIFPYFRISGQEILQAAIAGILFSFLLIKTTKFEIKDNDIYLINSKAFIYILFGLLAIRIVAKYILSSSIDVGPLGGMFWMLAFCMIVPWRIAMFINYKKLTKNLSTTN